MDEAVKRILNNYIAKFNIRGKIEGPNLYEQAVKRALNDAARVLKEINNYSQEKEAGIRTLAGLLEDYFDDRINFNHQSFCERFMSCFTNYRKVTIGVAQKIVNLSFKYLYCCNSFRTEKGVGKFQECEMALDSFVLKWCRKKVPMPDGFKISREIKWSQITDYNFYKYIQNAIKTYVADKGRGLSVLEYEIILWPNLLLLDATISFLRIYHDNKHLYQRNSVSDIRERINDIREIDFSSDLTDDLLGLF